VTLRAMVLNLQLALVIVWQTFALPSLSSSKKAVVKEFVTCLRGQIHRSASKHRLVRQAVFIFSYQDAFSSGAVHSREF
jgi:hypothetical protein